MADVSARALQPDLTELEEAVRRLKGLFAINSEEEAAELPSSDRAILIEVVGDIDSFLQRFVTLSRLICEAARYLTKNEPDSSLFRAFDADDLDTPDPDNIFIPLHNWLRQAKLYLAMLVAMEARREAESTRATTHHHSYFGEVHMGDIYQDISNSTIVSRSKVEGAFNRLQDGGQGESARLLVEIGKRVSDAGNPAAGGVYNQMADEISKPMHDTSIIKSCWDGLVAILPPLASLSAEVIKAFAI
jgi:hypothetical protein